MGVPAFVARLFPLSSLKATFLVEQVMAVINIVHESSGMVFFCNERKSTDKSEFLFDDA